MPGPIDPFLNPGPVGTPVPLAAGEFVAAASGLCTQEAIGSRSRGDREPLESHPRVTQFTIYYYAWELSDD